MDNFFRNMLTEILRIRSLITVHYFKYTRQFSMEGETHNFYELVYADSGKAELENGAEKFMLSQGEAFLHRPNVFHSIKSANEFTNIIVVTFELGEGDISAACDRVTALSFAEKELLAEIVRESRNAFLEPLDIVNLTKMTLKEGENTGCLQIIKNDLEKLLLLLLRKGENGQPKKKGSLTRKQVILNMLTQYLESNLDKSLTMEDISRRLGYSGAYLKKIFNAAYGCGIIHYHIMLKVEHAKKMIAEGNIGIGDISYRLAFSSPQYFCRIFKSMTNMTPSQYGKSVKALRLLP